MGLAIISFDAVSSSDIEFLSTQENFSKLISSGTVVTDVNSVFISNTYPVHSSVITGMYPNRHGVVENTFASIKGNKPVWRCYRDSIKTTTLYDEAKKAGVETCAVLWPVTGNANILKNLPEILPEEGKSQIITSLRAGSKWFQLWSFIKYGKYLNGIEQPELDEFATKCAVGASKNKNFDLLLLHLTDIDSHKHTYGPNSREAREAMIRADKHLGMIMKAYENWDFIVFGDHGCKPIEGCVNLNELWSNSNNLWHLAGGCAFLKGTDADNGNIDKLMKNPASHIKRRISNREMNESGLDKEFLIGVEAEDGYCFSDSDYKGNHGYSLQDDDEYKVFYAASGRNIQKNRKVKGGSIMDIAPLAAKILNLPLWDMDGELNKEVYNG